MAQGGKTKGLAAKSGSGGRKKTGTMKKGKREIAPKQKDHVREKSTKKGGSQLSAKINNNIERQMVNAAMSGKLTIMKNKGGEDAAKAAAAAKK